MSDDVRELRREVMRVSNDLGRGLAAIRVMLAERDARIAVLEERLGAARQRLDETRQAQDTASHRLSDVRAVLRAEEAKKEQLDTLKDRAGRYALLALKVGSAVAGWLAYLWHLFLGS